MQSIRSGLWRHLAGRWPIYRVLRQEDVKHVIPPLQPELLSDYLLRDLGLPADLERLKADPRLPRL